MEYPSHGTNKRKHASTCVHRVAVSYGDCMTNRTNAANQHASLRTRTDRTGKIRTETTGRDSGMDVALSTDPRKNSTRVFIDFTGRVSWSFKDGADMVLTGRQARTLYRALSKHFDACKA